jgi:hypothetical protein
VCALSHSLALHRIYADRVDRALFIFTSDYAEVGRSDGTEPNYSTTYSKEDVKQKQNRMAETIWGSLLPGVTLIKLEAPSTVAAFEEAHEFYVKQLRQSDAMQRIHGQVRVADVKFPAESRRACAEYSVSQQHDSRVAGGYRGVDHFVRVEVAAEIAFSVHKWIESNSSFKRKGTKVPVDVILNITWPPLRVDANVELAKQPQDEL